MDNRELTAAASAFIQWCNSQEISLDDCVKMMLKVEAKILCDRMKLGTGATGAMPDHDLVKRVVLDHNEALFHELISRIHALAKRNL